MSWCKAGCLALVAMMLAGCGFQPLYATRHIEGDTAQNAFEAFRGISISQIEDREGQLLRNQLSRLIHPSGRSGIVTHSLDVKLKESKTSLAVARSAVASRANIRVTASYTLVPFDKDAASLKGTVTATSGYNIFRSEFQTLSAENGARERALKDIAEQIRLRLAAQLTGPETATGAIR